MTAGPVVGGPAPTGPLPSDPAQRATAARDAALGAGYGHWDRTVLLHAIGLDAGQWAWCAALGGAWAVTLPGHGHEPMLSGETFSLDAVADAVADRIAHRPGVGPTPVDLVGLSLGGMVAQHLALRHPALVRSLVLVCTKPVADPHAMLARAEATERLGMGPLVEETLRRWFTSAAVDQLSHPGVTYARDRLVADDPAVIAAYWRAMADHDVRSELRRLRHPVTVVSGRHDVTTNPQADAEFAAGFACGRQDVCDGPHLLSLEAPSEMVAAVERHLVWVDGLAGDRRGPTA